MGTSGETVGAARRAPCVALLRGKDVWLFDAGEDTQRVISEIDYLRPSKVMRVHCARCGLFDRTVDHRCIDQRYDPCAAPLLARPPLPSPALQSVPAPNPNPPRSSASSSPRCALSAYWVCRASSAPWGRPGSTGTRTPTSRCTSTGPQDWPTFWLACTRCGFGLCVEGGGLWGLGAWGGMEERLVCWWCRRFCCCCALT